MIHVKKGFLQRGFVPDYEALRNLFIQNKPFQIISPPGSSAPPSQRANAVSSAIGRIEDASKKHEFALPHEPLFRLIHYLDGIDSSAAFLYTPGVLDEVYFDEPTLESMTSISEGLTRIFPVPLVSFYEGEKFKIPVLNLYEGGKSVRRTKAFSSNEEYNLRWKENFEKGVSDRMKRTGPEFVKEMGEALRSRRK
ncbi:hypothetical protein HY448_02120 [Candidatus Pacearchaeota archaeon]|nr:hypothetical protein [Candidatus Pacearchaeota archaeon]